MKNIKSLKSGTVFGDLALQSKKPRSATIICMTNCSFATVSKQNFEQAMA